MDLSGIGLAGCGRMGEPMLRALIFAGFDARGFDIKTAANYGPFARHISNNPRDFAKGLRILFTVVRDIAQTENLLFIEQQIIENAPDLQIIVLCSTLSPRYLGNLKTCVPPHITLIDAPMSGAAIAATEMRLSFMQGGDKSTLAGLLPLFQAMGNSFHHMGDFGAGMSAKVLNNLLAASNTVMTRLVLDWAQKQGLNPDLLLDLIAKSSGQNWFASGFNDIEFSGDGFASDNTIGILKKDVESALDAAPDSADTRLPDLLVNLIKDLQPM